MKSKVGVESSAISSTESELEESEHSHFLPTLLMTLLLCSAYDLVKTRLSELEAEAEG